MAAKTHDAQIVEIAIDELRPGMFLHELGVQWVFHPFVQNQFELDRSSIDKIRLLGVTKVRIDLSRSRSANAQPQETHQPRSAEPPLEKTFRSIGRGPDWARRLTHEARIVVRNLLQNARAGKAIDIQDIERVSCELSAALSEEPFAMLAFGRIRSRDQYTYQHSVNVGVLLMAFAKHLEMPEAQVRTLGTAGMLHDIGKVLIPEKILTKPAPLDEREYELMKSHTWRGAELLRDHGGVAPVVLDIAEHHHERLNGCGYPHRRTAAELGAEVRMAAIVDVYDAITAVRAYHNGRPPTEGLRMILAGAGDDFDAGLAQRFVRCIGVYPPGSLVRLNTEKLAVVLENRPHGIEFPLVRVVYDIRRDRMLDPPQTLDLASSGGKTHVLHHERPDDWAVPPELYL